MECDPVTSAYSGSVDRHPHHNVSSSFANRSHGTIPIEFNFTLDMAFYNRKQTFDFADYVIDRYIIHIICLFGMAGNVANLVVLTRKSLHHRMERLEKSAHIGLTALAVSDLMFCTCMLPHAWIDRQTFSSDVIDFWLVYKTYGHAVINVFLLSSCWLTVSMAICRYLAICHPFKARLYLGFSSSVAINVCVFLVSFVFNLPRFWMKRITYIECQGGWRSFFPMQGFVESDKSLHSGYMWAYFIFGILLPLLALLYCNIFLIKTLHDASKSRKNLTRTNKSSNPNVVTLTLSVIVVMYIFLVGPAEFLTFWRPFVTKNVSMQTLLLYGLAVNVCNALQALNFSLNFVLYCVINVHFRQTVKQIVLCRYFEKQRKRDLDRIHLRKLSNDSQTQETSVML